jgi:hypothetical protein
LIEVRSSGDLKDYCYPDSKGNSMFTPGLCIGITREQLAQMPTIYVVLDGLIHLYVPHINIEQE